MTDRRSRPNKAGAAVLQALFMVSLLWSAGALAWASLVPLDFGYSWLYGELEIDRHIAYYAPQNRYKAGFAETSRDERLALFGGIVDGVQAGGEGLAALRYRGPRGGWVPLLRTPEVVHLQSVARLIGTLREVSYLMLGVLALSMTLLYRRRLRLPTPRRVLVAALGGVSVAAALLLAIGPERVFNTLHTWIFPAGEQWYFFYQESLMTTLMKAPDLFGAIALLLVPLALAYFALLLMPARHLLQRRDYPTTRR